MSQLAELRSIVQDLHDTRPAESVDAREWQKKVQRFTAVWLVRDAIGTDIAHLIPLRDKPDFLAALKALHAGSRVYNREVIPGIQNSLASMLQILVAAEKKPAATLEAMARGLPEIQRRLFDLVWNYYSTRDQPQPARNLQIELGVRLTDAMRGLSGSQILEVQDNNNVKCYKLTVLGALMTGHRISLFGSLVHLTLKLKELYDSGSPATEFPSDALGLPEIQTAPLYKLLKLGPIRGMPFSYPHSTQGSFWKVPITEQLMDLHGLTHADIPGYVEQVLLASYDPEEPYDINQRMAYAAFSNRLPGTILDSASNSFILPHEEEQRPRAHAYVSPERINELE